MEVGGVKQTNLPAKRNKYVVFIQGRDIFTVTLCYVAGDELSLITNQTVINFVPRSPFVLAEGDQCTRLASDMIDLQPILRN